MQKKLILRISAIIAFACLIALQSCQSEVENTFLPEPTNKTESISTDLNRSEINPKFLDYLEEESGLSRVSDFSDNQNHVTWDIDKTIQVKDNAKDLIAQMTPSCDNPKLVAGAYYNSTNLDPTILIMEETSPNKLEMRLDDGELLMKFDYDPTTKSAVCTWISRQRIMSIMCNGAMITLGWEVSIILAVPSGGSSLAFGLLWGGITMAYCG